MSKWGFAVGVAFVLGGACNMRDDQFPDSMCPETVTSCRVVSGFGGYQRACSTSCTQQSVQPNRGRGDDDDDDGDSAAGEAPAAMSVPAASASASGEDIASATAVDPRRYAAFDIPCERDNQCGPGKCNEGNCYYGCHSDSQCGSGDRCSVESGTRVCQPDPNPPVECTRSAQCDAGSTCLNGACRQTCTTTAQCTNVLDRCGSGVCVPDRRPLGECVLNNECAAGLVCLDGSCVPACPNGREDAGACLAESPNAAPGSGSTPSELPPVDAPLTPPESDDGTEEPASEDPGDTGSEDDEGTTPEDTGESEPPAETGADAGTPISTIR